MYVLRVMCRRCLLIVSLTLAIGLAETCDERTDPSCAQPVEGNELLQLDIGAKRSRLSPENAEHAKKTIAGVPVDNYHLRRAVLPGALRGQLRSSDTLSMLQVGKDETVDWLVAFPRSVGGELHACCHRAYNSSHCLWEGHPVNGVSVDVIRATEQELESLLAGDCKGASRIEPNLPRTAIIEVQNREMADVDEPLSKLSEDFVDKVTRSLGLGVGANSSVATTFGAEKKISWNLDRIDDEMGLDKSYDVPNGGKGVHVYVLDTGVRRTHSEFEDGSGGSRALAAYDLSRLNPVCKKDDDDCANDVDGHGTHVAGTVAGKTYGVAKAATIHSVKILDDKGDGTIAWEVQAIDWVIQSVNSTANWPAIISISIGGAPTSEIERTAIEKAVEAGIVVVVAAGNNGDDACDYGPAFVPAAITVGATKYSTDNEDIEASYSNYGQCVDLYAPGSDILSASSRNDKASKMVDGTSQACPHVSGAAALLLEKYPDSSVADIIDMIKKAAVDSIINPYLKSDRLLQVNPEPRVAGSSLR